MGLRVLKGQPVRRVQEEILVSKVTSDLRVLTEKELKAKRAQRDKEVQLALRVLLGLKEQQGLLVGRDQRALRGKQVPRVLKGILVLREQATRVLRVIKGLRVLRVGRDPLLRVLLG